MADRSFALGVVIIRAYNYWWGYTAAQIELMCADIPVTNYSGGTEETKITQETIDELRSNWERKHGGRKNSNIKLTDILNGDYTNGKRN